MTQEQYNLIVRGVIFASSTDCCMDTDDMEGATDALRQFVIDHPEFVEGLDLGGLYIYGTDPKMQEDPEINEKLFKIFGEELENRG
jgi:hypothetical protein